MSFPTSPTIGQIAKLVSTGPDYIYRGLGKWDVLAMDPNFDPSGYVTTGVFDSSQSAQNTAITSAASAAAAAQSTATSAANAAASVAASAPNAANLTTGTVPDARLPGRLGLGALLVTDCNAATGNGVYYGNGVTAANAPPQPNIFILEYKGVSPTIGSQFAFMWDAASTSTSTASYRRDNSDGVWGDWYRVGLSRDELDARYVLAGGGVGVLTVSDWDAASSSGLYFGDNATHGPETSGQFIAEVWAVDADTAIARAVGLDGNNYVYQRAKTGGAWEASWTRCSDANGAVWHPGNMPPAQALWDDNTPNTLVKRGSTGNIKAPYGVFAGEVITTAPATIAIQSGTDGTIRWQALAKLAEHIAAQASFSGPLASIAAKVGDVRLGASVVVGNETVTVSAGTGSQLQTVTYSSAGGGSDVKLSGTARPLQKYVSDSWVTVSQV